MNPQDKPITMPLRDWIIKNIAKDKELPSSIVEAIVTHQFDSANIASNKHKSMEISGFGRFILSPTKSKYQLGRHEDIRRSLLKLMETSDDPILKKKYEGNEQREKELKKRLEL